MIDPNVLITACATVVTGAMGYFAPKVHKGLKTAQEVRDQVSNGHETNLRDDIDKLLEGQARVLQNQARHETKLEAHGDRLDVLQSDLEWERRERMDLARIVNGQTPLA